MAKKYTLTDEHRAQLPAWRDKWIANAMSTEAMTEEDRAICRDAVRRLYRAANLPPPPDHRIVFVPSPFVLRYAGGFAAWIWHTRKSVTHQATYQATYQATHRATNQATYQATNQATHRATHRATAQATGRATVQATHRATNQATYQATDQATHQATDQATYQATHRATDQATDQATGRATVQATNQATHRATYQATVQATGRATYQATNQATDQATYQATNQATGRATGRATDQATGRATGRATDLTRWYVAPPITAIANEIGVGMPGIICAQKSYENLWQGGNQWSAYDGFVSFFRHIVRLPIDYTAWDAWETLSLHSGPRIVHQDFCMISDRPEILTVDDQNRPHAEHGPFCRWRDGTALYSWHGVDVPAIWIEDRSSLTAAAALAVENVERRRAACEIVGWDRILSDLKAVTIHSDADPMIGELVEVSLPGAGRERFLRVVCGTGRRFAIPVPPTVQTALEANAWTYGLDASEYNPEYRT